MAGLTAILFSHFELSNDTSLKPHSPKYVNCRVGNGSNNIIIYGLAKNDTEHINMYRYIYFGSEEVYEIINYTILGVRSSSPSNTNINIRLSIRFLMHYELYFSLGHEGYTVKAQSPTYLMDAGINKNELVNVIYNKKIAFNRDYVSASLFNNNASVPMHPALKITYSQLPQSFDRAFTGKGVINTTVPQGGYALNTQYSFDSDVEVNYADIIASAQSQLDAPMAATRGNVTVIVPIPVADITKLTIRQGNGLFLNYQFGRNAFGASLPYLLNDLVQEVSITYITDDTLLLFNKKNRFCDCKITYQNMGNTTSQISFTISARNQSGQFAEDYAFGNMIRGISAADIQSLGMVPIFVLKCNPDASATTLLEGILEGYSYMQLPKPQGMNSSNIIFTSLDFAGNKVDLTGYNYITDPPLCIKRLPKGIRIYTNYNLRDYVDLPLDYDYSKNAFGNYVAYQKANLELAEKQALDAQKLNYEYQVNKSFNNPAQWTRALTGALSASLLTGSPVAGGGVLIGGALNSYTNFLQAQNDNAHAVEKINLNFSQQKQYAQKAFFPQEYIKGTTLLNDIMLFNGTNDIDKIILCSYEYYEPDDITEIVHYIYDNNLMININGFFPEAPIYSNISNDVYKIQLSPSDFNTFKDSVIIWVQTINLS